MEASTGIDLVLRFEDERLSAIEAGDTAWLARHSSADFIYVHSTGLVESGEQFCRMLESGSRKYLSLIPSDRSVRLHGGLAIIVGALDVKVRTERGDVVTGTRYTGVYDMTHHPVVVSWHSSPRKS